MPPTRALSPPPVAAAILLAVAYGLGACGSSSRTATPDPDPASSPVAGTPSPAGSGSSASTPGEATSEASDRDAPPDGGASAGQPAGASDDGSGGLRYEVGDAQSTCSKDEQCVLTRYPGCCCSTTDSAMPRPFAISKPDLEARKEWCDSHVERIDCDVSRCPPPADEQPDPEPRTVACVDGRCVSRTAEP